MNLIPCLLGILGSKDNIFSFFYSPLKKSQVLKGVGYICVFSRGVFVEYSARGPWGLGVPCEQSGCGLRG